MTNSKPAPSSSGRNDYDMDDNSDDLAHGSALRGTLKMLHAELLPT